MQQELTAAIAAAFTPETYKFILSGPTKGSSYKKIVGNRLAAGYQLEQYTQTQVFHRTVAAAELSDYLAQMLDSSFSQYNGWSGSREQSIRVSAKGKVLRNSRALDAATAPKEAATHNRTKNYLLQEGSPIAPLVDMGVFTAEGKVVRSMYDKYRQINRFIEMIDDEVAQLDPKKPITVIDFGCGKSYLTFVLYYYLTQLRGLTVRMVGLDLKQEVIEKCSRTAERYGYDGLHFELGDINGYQLEGGVDMVVTLHACDTATDYALYNAVQWGARMIFSVPCCQHELSGQLQSEELAILTRYGIVKERVASLMTDAVRANLLESCGYRTQLLEFIELEHTPKNLLIRAIKRPQQGQTAAKALAETEALMRQFGLTPTLYKLLYDKKTPSA